jgi:preprotein translocase subunit YajC
MFSLYQACWLLAVQITTPPGTNAPAANDAAAEVEKADPGIFGSLMTFLPMMLAVLVIFFLFSQKPGQKENVRTKELLDNLKKNDRIVTAGGILGTVVSVRGESDHVTIRIDENTNTKMQILKQSIIRVLKDDEKSEV